jgi:hypothetical protein
MMHCGKDPLPVLKMEDGATSQGMRAACVTEKGKQGESFLEPPKGNKTR